MVSDLVCFDCTHCYRSIAEVSACRHCYPRLARVLVFVPMELSKRHASAIIVICELFFIV